MEAINESNVSYGSIYGLRFGWVVGNFIQSYLYDTEIFFCIFAGNRSEAALRL